MKNKFIVGELATCIKNNLTNNNLITVGKEYKVLGINGTNNRNDYASIYIMTDADIILYINSGNFVPKKILRKNKLNKLNKINKIF